MLQGLGKGEDADSFLLLLCPAGIRGPGGFIKLGGNLLSPCSLTSLSLSPSLRGAAGLLQDLPVGTACPVGMTLPQKTKVKLVCKGLQKFLK